MFDPDATRQRLLDHWLKYMQTHPAYIADAIDRHFQKCPTDQPIMKPQLSAEWLRIKSQSTNA